MQNSSYINVSRTIAIARMIANPLPLFSVKIHVKRKYVKICSQICYLAMHVSALVTSFKRIRSKVQPKVRTDYSDTEMVSIDIYR